MSPIKTQPTTGHPPTAAASPRIDWNLYSDAVYVQPHEPLELYVPGGLHPVTLGDSLHQGRYSIRHKLGYGGYSTVWMARDLTNDRWVSIKIKTARASAGGLFEDSEIRALRDLEKAYVHSPRVRPRHFVQLLDCFRHEGPNGTHNCLVTELLGPTVSNVLGLFGELGDTLCPDTVLRTSRQLLEGLQLSHDAGIVHGDISPANVAFTCYNAQESDERLFETMNGQPVTAMITDKGELPDTRHLPKQLVKTAQWYLWYDSVVEEMRLIDWGLAFPVDKTVSELSEPLNLRSPETFFLDAFDYRHDLWRTGCLIYSLFYQCSPFPFAFGGDDFYLLKLVRKLGPLPPAWHSKWEDMLKENEWAEEDDKIVPPEPISETFELRRQTIISNLTDNRNYDWDEHSEGDFEALKCLLPAIKGLLQYEPEQRMSLRQAASCIEWIDYRSRETQSSSGEGEEDAEEEEVDDEVTSSGDSSEKVFE